MKAFEGDTLHRLLNEAARYWVVGTASRTGEIPMDPAILFAYADGPVSFDWGNPPGPELAPEQCPMRGKRVRITMEIEEH